MQLPPPGHGVLAQRHVDANHHETGADEAAAPPGDGEGGPADGGDTGQQQCWRLHLKLCLLLLLHAPSPGTVQPPPVCQRSHRHGDPAAKQTQSSTRTLIITRGYLTGKW